MGQTLMVKTKEVDRIIDRFNIYPENFDHNPWRCYSECKKVLYNLEFKNIINQKDFELSCFHVTERLGI